jgi:hypothetical protein
MPLIQISAGRDTTTWRPCAIYYIGITANPSKTCCLGIQRRRLQAASFSSGTGLPRCWNFYLSKIHTHTHTRTYINTQTYTNKRMRTHTIHIK